MSTNSVGMLRSDLIVSSYVHYDGYETESVWWILNTTIRQV